MVLTKSDTDIIAHFWAQGPAEFKNFNDASIGEMLHCLMDMHPPTAGPVWRAYENMINRYFEWAKENGVQIRDDMEEYRVKICSLIPRPTDP